MNIKLYKVEDDMKILFPVIDSWFKEAQFEEFGIEHDFFSGVEDLTRLINSDDGALLVMDINEKIIGFMGITVFKSPLSKQKIANEHYWYVLPEYRGRGIYLISSAYKWAKEKECSHIMMNASRLASQLHDKTCQIYERMGMKKFETTYIKQIGD